MSKTTTNFDIINVDASTAALLKKIFEYDNDVSATTEVTNFNPMYETHSIKDDTPNSPKAGVQQVSKPSLK